VQVQNNGLSGYGALAGKLLTTIAEGQKAQTDFAIKAIEVVAKQQLALQQQQTALMAVALLTGVGSRLNIFV
jgi:hypothetical protein